jgi:hypothetical protein
MNTKLVGQLLLSLVLVSTIVAAVGFDWIGWTGQHIFNPEWHPHARFHMVQLSSFVILLSLMSLWLVWRRSLEPQLSALIVTALMVFLWSGEFIALAIPGTSPSPILSQPNTVSVFGWQVPGNLIFTTVMIILSVVGYLMIGRGGT